jgi:hypothetical protein
MRDYDMRGQRPPEASGETESAAPDPRLQAARHRRFLQRKAKRAEVAPNAGAAVERAAQSAGQALPEQSRQKFERSLGTDLSGVRVHSGAASEEAADSVSAKAYTVGQDIHFGAGQLDPESAEGSRLLAHEVAHTVQQSSGGGSGPQCKSEISQPGEPLEAEADQAAEAMLSGAPASVSPATGLARETIQREEWDDPSARPDPGGPQMNGGEGEGFRMGEREEAPHKNLLLDGVEAVDWNAQPAPAEVPEVPPPTVKIERTPPAPGNGSLDDRDTQEFNRTNSHSYEALDQVATRIESSWSSMAPGVAAFQDAKGQIKDGGALGPAPEGENWNDVPADKQAYDQAANEQIVGGGTKLGDLFGDKGQLTGIDQAAVHGGSKKDQEGTSKLFEVARAEDMNVKAANDQFYDHVHNTIPAAGNDLQIAINNLKIEAETLNLGEAAERMNEAVEAKEHAKQRVEKGIGLFMKVGKVLATPGEAAVEAGGELLQEQLNEVEGGVMEGVPGMIASAIIGGNYDQEIARAKEDIASAQGAIDALHDQNLSKALATAMLKFNSVMSQIEQKKNDIGKALAKRHDAYRAAAAAAGAKGGKDEGKGGAKKGERIRAAIEAIPRVQTVLARIHAVSDRIDIPEYSAEAGLQVGIQRDQAKYGKGGNFDVDALGRFNGMLKAYKKKFDDLKSEWQERASSLDELMKEFNMPGT